MVKANEYDRRADQVPHIEGKERFSNQQTYEKQNPQGLTQDHGSKGTGDEEKHEKRFYVGAAAEAKEKSLRAQDTEIQKAMDEYAEHGPVKPEETFVGENEVEITDKKGDWLGEVDQDPKMEENLKINRLIRRRMKERLKDSYRQWSSLKSRLRTPSDVKKFFSKLRKKEGGVDYVSRDGHVVRPSEMKRYQQLVRIHPLIRSEMKFDENERPVIIDGKVVYEDVLYPDTLGSEGIRKFFDEVLATESKSKRWSFSSGIELGIPSLAQERAYVARIVREEQQRRAEGTQKSDEEKTRKIMSEQSPDDREDNIQDDIRKGWIEGGEEEDAQPTDKEVHAMDVAQANKEEEQENRELKNQAKKETYFGQRG